MTTPGAPPSVAASAAAIASSTSAELPAEAALHDVSNALTVMLGWLDAAIDPNGSEASRRRAIALATAGARQAQALARRAIGATTTHEPPANAGSIAHAAVDALTLEAQRRGLHVSLDVDSDGVVAEPSAVAHVLTNLLLNALAFAPSASAVNVNLSADASRVRFVVRDAGPGIPAEIAPRIFEGASMRPGGAGIGLPHARREARRLGGELRLLESERGASFELVLPRAGIDAVEPEPLPPSAHGRARLEGLVVVALEDDRAVCALLEAGLGARGAVVIAVHDAEELARVIAEPRKIDAILLDLSPIAHDVDGALATVRASQPQAGLVFISGSAIAVPAAVASDAPHVRWVRKPFEVAEVAQAVADIVESRIPSRAPAR